MQGSFLSLRFTVGRNNHRRFIFFDSRTRNTAGKNNELKSSIFPTSSITNRSVSSLNWKWNRKSTSYWEIGDEAKRTCNSGKANDSNDATSTLYLPTVDHLMDSTLPWSRRYTKAIQNKFRFNLIHEDMESNDEWDMESIQLTGELVTRKNFIQQRERETKS